jgi:hypothetical protein
MKACQYGRLLCFLQSAQRDHVKANVGPLGGWGRTLNLLSYSIDIAKALR